MNSANDENTEQMALEKASARAGWLNRAIVDVGFFLPLIGLLFFGGVIFPPFAFVILFFCVLQMIIKSQHRNEKPIQDDKDLYRTRIRPIARYIVWAPGALLTTLLLLATALFWNYIFAAAAIAVPVIVIAFLIKDHFAPIDKAALAARPELLPIDAPGTNDQA